MEGKWIHAENLKTVKRTKIFYLSIVFYFMFYYLQYVIYLIFFLLNFNYFIRNKKDIRFIPTRDIIINCYSSLLRSEHLKEAKELNNNHQM